jgi:hypothetical protein
MTSPDGEWIAETSFEQPEGEEEFRTQFKVYRVDNTQTWSLVDIRQSGLGYSYTRLHQWSGDSRYLYFSGWVVADGGCGDFFPLISSWQRLDVETGQVSDFPLPTGRGHAFSPDDAYLAYASAGVPVQIHLLELSPGAEQSWLLLTPGATSDTAQAGNLLWSPTGEAFLVVAASSAFCAEPELEFTLWRIDLAAPEPTVLVSEGEDLLWPLRWVDDSILVRDWDQRTWWIDALNGQMTTAPEAP